MDSITSDEHGEAPVTLREGSRDRTDATTFCRLSLPSSQHTRPPAHGRREWR